MHWLRDPTGRNLSLLLYPEYPFLAPASHPITTGREILQRKTEEGDGKLGGIYAKEQGNPDPPFYFGRDYAECAMLSNVWINSPGPRAILL